jgi:aryl-alcohol dehydrogenase-like predicted oxidoreductase
VNPGRPALGIGGVQFGQAYGAVDRDRRPSPSEIREILEVGAAAGIAFIDTAPVYGESEELLGNALPAHSPLRICTKTAHLDPNEIDVRGAIRRGLEQSLRALQRSQIDAILIHRPDDALGTHAAAIMDALIAAKEEGLVKRIGVSLYDQRELNAFRYLDALDIVQLPISLLDQRLVASGALADLARRKIQVVARSVLLQGLLLCVPDRIPDYFAPIRPTISRIQNTADQMGLTPLHICLGFMRSLTTLDGVVLGVKSLEQLHEILSAWSAAPTALEWDAFAATATPMLDPRVWPANAA